MSGIYDEIRKLHQEIKLQKGQITKLKDLAMVYFQQICPICGGQVNDEGQFDKDIKKIMEGSEE